MLRDCFGQKCIIRKQKVENNKNDKTMDRLFFKKTLIKLEAGKNKNMACFTVKKHF